MERRLFPWAALIAIVVLPHVVADRYFMSVIIVCGIYALFAVSLDLIVGFLGVYSFGHAAFLGLGAYTSGILITRYDVSFWLTMPLAAAIAGGVGFLFALPAWRTRGIFFAITTLALAEIVQLVIINVPDVTRGSMGLSIPRPEIPKGFVVDDNGVFFYVTYGLLFLATLAILRFMTSPAGRGLVAIRENEDLAASIGIPVQSITTIVFVASAGLAGLAGSIYGGYIGIASPDLMSVNYSALALLMVIVGGRGTVFGAIMGAFIFSVVTEIFRVADEWRMIAFSLLLIVSMIAMPRGIVAPLLALLDGSAGRRK